VKPSAASQSESRAGPSFARRLAFGLALVPIALAYFALYLAINRYSAGRQAAVLFLPGEALLPLVPQAALIYAVGFVLPAIFAWYVSNAVRFLRALLAFGIAATVAFLTFLVFPVCFERSTNPDGATGWLRLAYLDDPCNCFPSLHVTICWLVYFACRSAIRRPKVLLTAVWAISLSTILVKQHYVVDVGAGILLAFAAWRVSELLGVEGRSESSGRPAAPHSTRRSHR
jgi:membrane-associated phospholipid phosphatase